MNILKNLLFFFVYDSVFLWIISSPTVFLEKDAALFKLSIIAIKSFEGIINFDYLLYYRGNDEKNSSLMSWYSKNSFSQREKEKRNQILHTHTLPS